MDNKKVWFVTGASKGLGLTLVKKLLADGYEVAATSRSNAALVNEVGQQSHNFLPLEADIANEKSVRHAVETAWHYFKTIDVVVNNAGYGQIGTLEELSDEESRKNFDVNVFGTLNVIRNVMPHLREQKSGYIFNIASVGGYDGGFPGWGIYCSTKFAVAGLTEALAAEVKAFGVNVTLVYPGYFRTHFLSKESAITPKKPIEEYEEARQSQSFHQNSLNGNQQGDPEKAIDVIIKMAQEEKPPLHLFLGMDAYELASKKIELVKQALEKWKDVTISTGFNI